MNTIHSFADALANTLIHSVWQGAVLALVLAVLLGLVGRDRSRTSLRYGLCCVALFALPAWSLLTFLENVSPGESKPAAAMVAAPAPDLGSPVREAEKFAATTGGFPWRDGLVLFWMGGLSIAGLRLAGGAVRLRRLVWTAAPLGSVEVLREFERVRARLGIRERVCPRVSDRVDGPLLAGFLWPAVILPPALLTGMPPAYLRAVFAHELAHFRRWDPLINALQCAVESLYFHHPAIWWISRQVRIEREHGCDELASRAVGDLRNYAGALAWLENRRVGAGGGEFSLAMVSDPRTTRRRIERLIGSTQQGWAGESTLLGPFAMLALAGFFLLPGAGANDAPRTDDGEAGAAFAMAPDAREPREGWVKILNGIEWVDTKARDDGKVRLFQSPLIVERGGVPYDLRKEPPRLFPEVPNRWLLDHELNFLDGGLMARDPDGDGFTVLEEYRAGTRPRDGADHPSYVEKLRFEGRQRQVYRIVFAAEPGGDRVQLNRFPSMIWERATMMAGVGEVTEDGQLEILSREASELRVKFVPTGREYRLPKGKPVEMEIGFAAFEVDLPNEKVFYVKEGETFRLLREPDRKWTLRSVTEVEAVVVSEGAIERRVSAK
ncbi:MAG: M56 family metallopeptidase [Verrucomicrobiae bacterium]|nr:M56 family metallopeptidase [Verrucomicrobiae bacterium]